MRSTTRIVLLALGLTLAQAASGCHANVDTASARPAPGEVSYSAKLKGAAGDSFDQELWIIQPSASRHRDGGEGWLDDLAGNTGAEDADVLDDPEFWRRVPGNGGIVTDEPATGNLVVVPLKHTDVRSRIRGDSATVDVTQSFENPYDTKIEAVYVFPLPEDAAVHEFVMTVGERKIRGIVREREEAMKIYLEARSQGYVASLLTQERPNVFTQKVANIEPGKAIDVEISYFHNLAYDDGWYEYTFPMVVGPRFNPTETLATGEGIAALPRRAYATSGQATEVAYLRPEERSGHDIALSVDLDAGVSIEELECGTHEVDVTRRDERRAVIALGAADRIPNKDFVLRYKVAGDRLKASFLTHADDTGGYFSFTIFPPAELADVPRSPMEMVFVIDCSGSMRGAALELAQDAIHEVLDRLRPSDTFQILRFSDESSSLTGGGALAVTPRNLREAKRRVDRLDANGGTQMISGIRAALRLAPDSERQRLVAFMTDGYIGNEEDILSEIQNHIGDTRIFSFGIGTSPNRFLLERMAYEGRGAVAYVGAGSDAAEVMGSFFERISHPALTDVGVDWNGLAVSEVLPSRMPDVFLGRPITVRGRFAPDYSRTPTGLPRVTGRVAGEAHELALPLALEAAGGPEPAGSGLEAADSSLPLLWARAKIADLTSRARGVTGPGGEERSEGFATAIRGVALEYGLLSAYTAFIAVDSSRVTEGEYGTTVPVAVPVPEGVRYDTTVGGD